MLSPSSTIATFQPDLTQHCWVQHAGCVWPPCCDVLQHVGWWYWLEFEKGQIFHATFVDAVAWCCSLLARLVQCCCGRACALIRFPSRDMSQHVATRWPNACKMSRPTMMWSIAFKWCDLYTADIAIPFWTTLTLLHQWILHYDFGKYNNDTGRLILGSPFLLYYNWLYIKIMLIRSVLAM